MDVMKVRSCVYQYTATDDYTRYRVLAVYPIKPASPHLNGKAERSQQTVYATIDIENMTLVEIAKEYIREKNYKSDLLLAKLKGCV